MRVTELFESATVPEYLFHVTLSRNVDRIKSEGLKQFEPSNWSRGDGGDRYNEDAGIFAFEHPADAVRWALKMEWDFKEPISIVRLDMEEFWNVDPTQDINLTMMGKGRPMKSQQNIKADKIVDAFDLEQFSKPGPLGISFDEWSASVEATLRA